MSKAERIGNPTWCMRRILFVFYLFPERTDGHQQRLSICTIIIISTLSSLQVSLMTLYPTHDRFCIPAREANWGEVRLCALISYTRHLTDTMDAFYDPRQVWI